VSHSLPSQEVVAAETDVVGTRPSAAALRVGLSHDLFAAGAETSWGDVGLGRLRREGMQVDFLPPDDGVLRAEDLEGFDVVIFAQPRVDATSFADWQGSASSPETHGPLLLARFGVGLDAVDLESATASGVAVTVTPDGAARPVATAALALLLATSLRLVEKDRWARQGRWHDRLEVLGAGLTAKVVGLVGLGNIGTELCRLLAPFNLRLLAADPAVDSDYAAARGVTLVSLEALFEAADAVVITASASASNAGLVGAGLLGLLKPTAVLVNVSRGSLVDLDALTEAVLEGRIAGAGLDVFDREPLDASHPILSSPRVVVAPHCLAWTDEMAKGNGRSVCDAVLAVASGRIPRHLANPEVLGNASFIARLGVMAKRRSQVGRP